MTKIQITEHIGPQEVNAFYGGFIKVARNGTAHEYNTGDSNVVTSPAMDPYVSLYIADDRARLLHPMRATSESMRWLANFLNSAADHLDRGLTVPEERPVHEPVLLVTDDSGDTFYTGDLDAAKRLVAEERDVNQRVHANNHWTVDLIEKGAAYDEGEADVAEYGKGRTEEQAWRYALGAYFGPVDSEYDEMHVMRALARGTWHETGDSHLVLPPARTEADVDLLDDPWRTKVERVDWEPTHVSAQDGSPARQVGFEDNGLTLILENEGGDVWPDPAEDWRPIKAEPDLPDDDSI